jgi:transcriptional regulator with XRE-family HTH domain
MTTTYNPNISSILKMLLSNTSVSEAEIARRINIPTATLNKIKTGKITDPRSSTLITIAHYFGITVDQLLGNSPIEKTFSKNICFVPLLNDKQILKVDITTLNYSNHESWISFNANKEITNHKLFAVGNMGDAMWPYFDKDTIAIIDCQQKVGDKQYVLAHIKATCEILLRQILIDGNHKVLKPVNPAFSLVTLTEEDLIIGGVIHSIRKHN